MSLVLLTYEDGTQDTLDLSEAAFGSDATRLHGPVVSASIAPTNVPAWLAENDDIDLPTGNRAARSMVGAMRDLNPDTRPTPVYGTGLDR